MPGSLHPGSAASKFLLRYGRRRCEVRHHGLVELCSESNVRLFGALGLSPKNPGLRFALAEFSSTI